MKSVILVKVRDVHLILNINNVLRKDGFYDFQSKYIGGMWLWIEFDSIESCQKLQSNKEMSWYLAQMKHVTQSFKVDELVVWVKIGGLPLNAWTSKAYKKIACNWGEPLFVDEDPHDNVAIGRVCIRTKIQGQITKTCKVVIHGQSHNVMVKKFAGWVPDIEAMDSLSGKNSNMGISDNHNDVNSDNDAQDAEEGEIRKTNEVNEENVVNSHHFSWADDEVNIAKDHDDSSYRNQSKESTVRGSGNIMDDSQRSTWLENLCNIELKENLDIFQKAKVKWGIEADENSKFFYDTIKDDVTMFVQDFFNTAILPQGCNTSFIALIPKMSNPMMVSDFPISLIGAQYKIIAKAMAIRLAQVMCFMGFSEKCITCIKGCLYSTTSSVLVNGSHTREFHINRGLRQGDPLSLFLFIIAIEGLHVAVKDDISAGLYRGLTVNTLTLSHFFFAYDALFIGEWSCANIKSMASILECFHRVSGLKINFHKSNLAGVGVPFEEVNHFSQITGCNAMQSSFLYLGLLMDCNMAYTKSWVPILDKFSKCLSKWKSSLLSIGGKTTLLSSILGAIVLASKEKGGISIGSLYSLNHALIQKWRWCFFNNPQALWVLLIKSIHGEHRDGSSFYNHVRDQGVWGRIVRSINSMHEKGLVSHSFFQRRDIYSWLEDMRVPSSQKSILEVICGVVLWSLWSFRNELIFGTSPPKRSILFDKIVDCSYSDVKGNGDTAVKASAGCNWRNKRNTWNKVFKYNSGSKIRKSVNDPLGRHKSGMAWVPKRN
nr:RNA-directed DNA polymerase, eukaryota, reverse transcriptase zinc-binding domain protein [Tanacetum cinerariifolium]